MHEGDAQLHEDKAELRGVALWQRAYARRQLAHFTVASSGMHGDTRALHRNSARMHGHGAAPARRQLAPARLRLESAR